MYTHVLFEVPFAFDLFLGFARIDSFNGVGSVSALSLIHI